MTVAADHPARVARARAWAGRALGWWLGELCGLYRDLARHVETGRRGAVTVEAGERYWVLRRRDRPIGQIDWQAGDPADALQALHALVTAGRGRPTAMVEIPPERALSKVVTLPAAAGGRLDRIVEFEIARHFPFPAERVFFRHRVVGTGAKRGGGPISVEIVAVPRDTVAAIGERLRDAGLRPSGVAAAPGNGEPLLLPPLAWGSAKSARSGSRAPAIVAAALALGALLSWPVAQRVRLDAVEAELAALKPQAETVLRARDKQRRETERSAAILQLRAARQPLVAALDALSRDLPADSWLLSLSVTGRDVVLDGLSPSAAATALALERSRVVTGITFRSPMTRETATGLEHFQLGATLAPGTKP